MGLVLLSMNGRLHGLHFETSTACLRWTETLRSELGAQNERAIVTPEAARRNPHS